MSTGKFKEVGKLTRAQSKRCLDATAPVISLLLRFLDEVYDTRRQLTVQDISMRERERTLNRNFRRAERNGTAQFD